MIGHEEHEELIRPAAYSGMRGFSRYSQWDDVLQSVYLWWYGDGQQYAAQYTEAGEEGKLSKAIERVARRYCEGEKAAAVGYSVDDVHTYTRREVRYLLPLALDPDGGILSGVPVDGSPPSKGDPAEGGNLAASLADIRSALGELGGSDRSFAVDYVTLGEGDVVSLYDILPASAEQRFGRILTKIVSRLGGGPTRRRAMTNATAMAVTGNNYEGQ